MRLVAIADTHLFHAELRVPDGDLLVHAGDLCREGTLEQLREAADWLRSLPHVHKIVVAGNHDWAFANEPERARELLKDVVYLEDSGTTIAGLRLWGSPWQPEFNDWAFNLPRGSALAEKWALIPNGIDVLITHGPPAGFGDRSSVSGRQGCAALLVRLRQLRPRLHVSGHIHEDGGAWREGDIQLVNVTTWECERGATVIDFEGSDIHVSAPPRCTR